MRQVQLSDQLYDQAKRRAAAAGFKTVDDFVADVLADELIGDTPDLDHLFTAERLAHIDKAAAQVKAGKTHTAAEVREHFRKRFEA